MWVTSMQCLQKMWLTKITMALKQTDGCLIIWFTVWLYLSVSGVFTFPYRFFYSNSLHNTSCVHSSILEWNTFLDIFVDFVLDLESWLDITSGALIPCLFSSYLDIISKPTIHLLSWKYLESIHTQVGHTDKYIEITCGFLQT